MWLDQQVSLYDTYTDNLGRPATYREILNSENARDNAIITKLRGMDKEDPEYKAKKTALKGKLRCYTPAALLKTKAKNQVSVIKRTGVMQLDFDYGDIHEYDVEELKRAVFNLPFIGFCGLSCSGDGFYALGLIEEPEKLDKYAEHCFDTLLDYGIKADTSKGKKVENLRYVSYDENMLIREKPTPLFIKEFKKKTQEKKASTVSENYISTADLNNERIAEGVKMLCAAQVGSRWQTVQKVAYAFGGLGNAALLNDIKHIIDNNSAFQGEEEKYRKCADDCFTEGKKNPYKERTSSWDSTDTTITSKQKDISFLPFAIMDKTMKNYEHNNCYLFLRSLFSDTVAVNIIETYCIGTSKKWAGASIFWQIDRDNKIHEAKLVLCKADSGKVDCQYIFFAGKDIANDPEGRIRRCFFGEHLLSLHPDQPVALALNEIDAMVASVYYPEYVWLATGGDRGCAWSDKDVCQALADREVVLFPESSCYEKWRIKAGEIQQHTTCKLSFSNILRKDQSIRAGGLSLTDHLLENRDSTGWAMTTADYPLFWDLKTESV